ncbi:dihydroorotase [Sphingobacterium hungaricum]|uniref:Dihydroorotase n=1 Tax=Sphingobacterium hungaricum TaxID=2082723 RepID=A0A928UT88_9SPHI|nr:dihydroorotase [Sphingobacterium hungaricum]MBE8712418.1 dihydroorotase [Sphingobacterium hungaricum]
MNTFQINSATLLSPENKYHNQVVDVLIEKGRISKIAKKISSDKSIETIDGKGSYLSAGFFDLNANFGEPGLETKEDLKTGAAAAAAGGFTAVTVQPNTAPPIHSRSEVSLIVNSSKGFLVDVFPIGSISKNREGKELAELYDMQSNGAIAFSDGNKSIQEAGLMNRALLYAKGFDGLIISFPQDHSIAADNKMNEGIVSTYLGMKGIPNLAETLMISRDIYLAEYNDSSIHFTTISTADTVDLVKKAKAKGLKVTCDVAAHHLYFTEEEVVSFDSNFKVSPPLRTKKDVKALLKGLKDGTIDAIVSQHTPHEIEFKNVEFHIAKNGIIGLQTVLPILVKAGLEAETIVEKLAIAPRKLVNIEVPNFEEGSSANFVLFNIDETWVFDEKTNHSKSKNSPLLGQELKGKVKAVFNNDKLNLNN